MLEITWHLFQIYTILSQCTLAYIFNYIISQIRHKLQVGVDSIFACTVTVVLAAPGWLKTPVGRSAGKSLAVRGWRAAGVAVPAADARWMHGGIFFFFFALVSRSHLSYSQQRYPPCTCSRWACTPPPRSSTSLTLGPSRRPTKEKKTTTKQLNLKTTPTKTIKNPPKKPKQKSKKEEGGGRGGGSDQTYGHIKFLIASTRRARTPTKLPKVKKRRNVQEGPAAVSAAREHWKSWAVKLVVGG